MAINYWEILGLTPGASDVDLHKAFRQLARKYHPDAHHNKNNPNAADKFKEISAAYHVLKDPERRAHYQASGLSGDAAGMDFASPFNQSADFGEIYDIFGDGWGRPAKQVDPTTGADVFVTLEISLAEAALGTEKTVSFGRTVTCSICDGDGCRPGTVPSLCDKCHGSGEMKVEQNTAFGRFVGHEPCDACTGEGKVIADRCPTCGGGKTRVVATQLNMHVPAGVKSGDELRAEGYGEPGQRGGDPGDLYILVSVLADDRFRRQDDDLIMEVPVSVSQAALGATIPVATISGDTATIHVPKGSQYGHEIILPGLGILQAKTGERGRQIIRLKVTVPIDLSLEEERLLRALASLRNERHE